MTVILAVCVFILATIWWFNKNKISRVPDNFQKSNGNGILLLICETSLSLLSIVTLQFIINEFGLSSVEYLLYHILELIQTTILLFAIPYFYSPGSKFSQSSFRIKWNKKVLFISSLFLITISICFLIIGEKIFHTTLFRLYLSEIFYFASDIFYFLSLIIFGTVVNKYFRSRNIGALGVLSIVIPWLITIVYIAISFIPNLFFDFPEIIYPIYLTVRVIFCFIYISLSVIWLYENVEQLIPLTFEKRSANYFNQNLWNNKAVSKKPVSENEFSELIRIGTKEELKKMIAENNVKEVLSRLAIFFEKLSDIESLNTVIILSGNFYELNLKSTRGTISYEQYKIEKAIILSNLLELLDNNDRLQFR